MYSLGDCYIYALKNLSLDVKKEIEEFVHVKYIDFSWSDINT